MRAFFRSVTLFELCSTLGGRPTVGPQTLNLLIGVQIPASQFNLPKPLHCVATSGKFLLFRFGVRGIQMPRNIGLMLLVVLHTGWFQQAARPGSDPARRDDVYSSWDRVPGKPQNPKFQGARQLFFLGRV